MMPGRLVRPGSFPSIRSRLLTIPRSCQTIKQRLPRGNSPMKLPRLLASLFLATTPMLLPAQSPQDAPAQTDFFERKIRPLLVNNCYTCHSADTNSKGGLRVDDRNGLIHGGSSGSAIVPGDIEKSLLLKRVTNKDV